MFFPNAFRCFAYFTVSSNAPCAKPTACAAIPIRPPSSALSAIFSPCPSSPSRFSTGTTQSFSKISTEGDERCPILSSWRPTRNPANPGSTKNAEIPLPPAAGSVFANTISTPAAGGKGISAFLVEPGFAGFRVGRHEDKMGQRSSPSVEILLNDCVVPAENRLGEEGQGLKIALSALDGGRIGIAAQAVGLAQGALEETVKYAKQRKAFGKSIGEVQAIQLMIADMQTEIEAARGLVYYTAWLKDAHPTKMGASASKAKLYASEMVNRVVYKAVQAHGAVGNSRETDVERMYRDARVITIYEGTSEVQRMIIARELLGAPDKQKVAVS